MGSTSPSRDPSITTLRSYMGIGPMNMEIDHSGGSPWDGTYTASLLIPATSATLGSCCLGGVGIGLQYDHRDSSASTGSIAGSQSSSLTVSRLDVPSQGQSPNQSTPKTEEPPSLGWTAREADIWRRADVVPGSSMHGSATSTSSALPPKAGNRTRGPPRRFGTQSTRLEAVDDSLGPLGPLGDTFVASSQSEETLVEPPAAQAQVRQPRSSAASSQSTVRTMMESANLQDEAEGEEASSRPRAPPPVQPPAAESPQRQMQKSVSVVEAAKPTFHVIVGDPHKVGDLTSAHTEYQVTTQVCYQIYGPRPEY
jgi:hypothetical protein